MHPLLQSPKHILLIGLLWSPICFGIVLIHISMVEIAWWQSVLLILPPMVILLFVCLSTWYICKGRPIESHKLLETSLKHIFTVLIIVALWIFLTMLYSRALDSVFKKELWESAFGQLIPLFGIIGIFFYFLFCMFNYLIISIQRTQNTKEQYLQQQILTKQAELKSLRSTIHPHFLFNSLTALSALTVKSPKAAHSVCLNLSEFLRYSLKLGREELVTIEEELDHIKSYLEIEKIRLGDRLKTEFEIDKGVIRERIPPLTLLPLVENSVKHGIEQLLKGGKISISIEQKRGNLKIKVINPYDVTAKPAKGEKHGLKTLKDRIERYYKTSGNLNVKKDEKFYTVTLYIPAKKDEG
jgi:two-component system LytT family sensor kinase